MLKEKLVKMDSRNLRKERIGIVTSSKMQKSVVVSEVGKVKHPKYGKFVLKTKKYHVHDENNKCVVGELIKIRQCRPISKTKTWMLVEE